MQHDEADFAEKFNEFGSTFKTLFSNIEIIGNYDKPSNLECFDIYIRGVGPVLDRVNIYFLFFIIKKRMSKEEYGFTENKKN